MPSVIEINLNSLPEHYSDYFFHSILRELPEAFIVAEISNDIIGYVMCKIEYGFSNFRKLGFVKKGHVVSIALSRKSGVVGSVRCLWRSLSGIVYKKYVMQFYLEVRTSNNAAIKM